MRNSKKLLKIKAKDFFIILILLLIFGFLGWGLVISYLLFFAFQSPVLMFMVIGILSFLASAYLAYYLIKGTEKVVSESKLKNSFERSKEWDIWERAINGSAVAQRMVEDIILSIYTDLLVFYTGKSEREVKELIEKPEICKKIIKNDILPNIAYGMWKRKGDLKYVVDVEKFRREVEIFITEIEKYQ